MTDAAHSPAISDYLAQHGVDPESPVDVRRIGTDADMVEAIIDRIRIREKTMTYSLPWIVKRESRPEPVAGLLVVALDANAKPALLLRLNRVKQLAFGDVSADDVAEEGLPMRDLAAWRPLHIMVWNEKLAPFGLSVNDDMPVTAEYFELLDPQN